MHVHVQVCMCRCACACTGAGCGARRHDRELVARRAAHATEADLHVLALDEQRALADVPPLRPEVDGDGHALSIGLDALDRAQRAVDVVGRHVLRVRQSGTLEEGFGR